MRPAQENHGHHGRLERLVENARIKLQRWIDAPEHDPGSALVELFAFLGDTLSSYADAIGTESFLGPRARVADLQVAIDGETWQRVVSLTESEPGDPHYVVTVAHDGATVIQFGDGINGRRLPANGAIRVSYRSGRRHESVTLQPGRVVLDRDWNEPVAPSLCGVHRAIVIDAVDPQEKRRLLLQVPSLLGPEHRWALPCLPPEATADLPSTGDTVWVAFEACDLDHPVWLGVVPT
jgi:hypothetical protein